MRGEWGYGRWDLILTETNSVNKPREAPGRLYSLFQRPFLRGLYLKELITEGDLISKSAGLIYISKSIGLAYSCREIYVSNLQKVFTETRLEDVDLTKPQPCKYFVLIGTRSEEIQAKS